MIPQRAHVTSLEALKSFRNSLIIYVSKARPTLEEASADVVRTKLWLENDQRLHWEREVRRRTRKLEEAQQAVFSAKMSNLRDVTVSEMRAFQKAREALDEAEAKLRILKRWNKEFASRTEPLARQLEKLHTVLAHDMTKAIAYLTQAADTLDAYAAIAPAPHPSSPAQPGAQDTAEQGATPRTEAGVSPAENDSKS